MKLILWFDPSDLLEAAKRAGDPECCDLVESWTEQLNESMIPVEIEVEVPNESSL